MNTKDSGDENLIIKCDDIQALLFEYAERELGDSRSALVREHLRQCPKCQDCFTETMNTIAALQNATTPDHQLPDKLSDEHYAHVIRAITHPILNWMFDHHVLISIITAIIVLILTLFALRTVKIWKLEKMEDLDKGYEIYLKDIPVSSTTNHPTVIHWHKDNNE